MEASGGPALIGTLSYRLPIPTTAASSAPTAADSSSSSSFSNQKKKRPRHHGDNNNGDDGSSFSIPTAAGTSGGASRPEPRQHRTGWVLNDTWMLSMAGAAADPQHGGRRRRLARLAATALFHQWPVRIDAYYRHNDIIGGGLVVVHDLCLCKEEDNDDGKEDSVDDNDDDRVNNYNDDFLTLRQIGRLERGLVIIDNAAKYRSSYSNDGAATTTVKQQQQQKTTTTRTKKTYSLRAAVAAISPIIVMDDNPFALMELCDDKNCHDDQDDEVDETEDGTGCLPPHRCVVVLRGPGLVYAADDVLMVGEAVRFRDVRRQRWRIPTVVPSAPSHVFVLPPPHDDDDNNPSRLRTASFFNHHHSLLLLSSVPHYFWTGTIRSVQWLPTPPGRGGQTQQRQLHFIEVEQEDDKNDYYYDSGGRGSSRRQEDDKRRRRTMTTNIIQIFVTYFPMSVALQCSLRTGARIAAANLHRIGPRAWAATLRSQLLVVRFAAPMSSSSMPSSLDAALLTPYAWTGRIRVPYARLGLQQRLVSYLLPSWRRDALDGNVPSVDVWVAALVPRKFSSASSKITTIRNAYAEFFDHDPPSYAAAPNTSTVADLRALAKTQLLDRLEKRGAVGVGWNASFRVDLQELMEDDNHDDDEMPLYTLGYLKTLRKAGTVSGSLSDGHSETPVIVPSQQRDVFASDRCPSSFAWVEIQSVHVACLCISDATGRHVEPSVKNLPFCQETSSNSSIDSGGAWLVLVDGRLYVATILLVAASIKCVGDIRRNTTVPTTTAPQYVTVEECLQSLELLPRPILGMLVRPWWTPTKLKSSIFNGLEVTVGHAASATADDPVTLPLQTIDFKPSIAIHNAEDFVSLVKAFIEGCDVPLEHLILGAVWWKLADDASLCSLLIGGWDDGQGPSTSEAVMVAIPSSCLTRDPKRGFVRFRCSIDDITASLMRRSCSKTELHSTAVAASTLFHFESRSSKIVVGMLARRPQRIGPSHDLVLSSSSATLPGVPRQRIICVFADLLDDLRTQSRQHMRPSLVRAIPNATFLGVSYCRAHASCAKCHQELKLPKQQQQGNQRQSPHGYNSTVFGTNAKEEDHRSTTALQCPNGCNVQLYGYIKWECSGLLDDGTGQAKLYAEREAATRFLLMSGGCGTMSETQRRAIEQGVWTVPGGIVFSKTTPPKASLKFAVMAARRTAVQRWKYQTTKKYNRSRMTEDDVLRHMTALARAEYLMEWTCRCPQRRSRPEGTATNDRRRRLYLVRCKPLADAVVHVGQTDVQLANHHDGIFTYTLPPLQLVLVDCAIVEAGLDN